MADRKVISESGSMATFQISVKDREETRTATFTACKGAKSFKGFVNGLAETAPKEGEDSPLEVVYGLYIYAADLKARAAAREAVAVDSTVIKRDGKEIDLMKLPVEKGVAAVNAAFALAGTVGGDPQNAFVATRRKLLEAKIAMEKEGMLVVVKR